MFFKIAKKNNKKQKRLKKIAIINSTFFGNSYKNINFSTLPNLLKN